MSKQHEHGQWGEEQACAYLMEQGMEVLERNWRYKRAEVDVIGKEGKVLVFVEVKTRAYTSFGRPEENVGRHKRQMMTDAAMAYMRATGHEGEIRFDIVSVVGVPERGAEILHFRDAFFPGLGSEW